MPIPKPKTNESRQQFLKRCMGDDTMTSEYTDSNQRLAVCTTEYDSYKEDSTENEKHIRAVEETDDSYIIEFGKSKPDVEETENDMDSKEVEKESIEIKSSIKAYNDEEEDKNYGTFEGYGSVFGNKDLGNDVRSRCFYKISQT